MEIYYFTGTGNSLAVARDIAEKVNGKLIPIPTVMKQEIVESEAGSIGFVFPVYNQGIPFIIRRFIEKFDSLKGRYIFAVCTHGGGPGLSMEYLDTIIKSKGGKLAAGYTVRMPYNYITPSLVLKDFFKSFTLREEAMEKQQKMFAEWKVKLEHIGESVQAKKEDRLETTARAVEYLIDLLNLRNTLQKSAWLKVAGFKGHTDLSFIESIQLMDYGFWCGDNCNSCTICTKVCPVDNIVMNGGRPVWQHQCEQCFACLQWCPGESIQFGRGTAHGKRYHHPAVKLSDMII